MKSRSSSPQTAAPSPQPVVRKQRVGSHTSTLASATGSPPPSLRKSPLRIEDFAPLDMNGTQTQKSPTSATANPTTPVILSPSSNSARKLSSASPPPSGLLNPAANGVRKLSSEFGGPPQRTDSAASVATTQNSENSQQWSSAVGHATTSGKSGRVIEKLMADKDRINRDLNAQIIKCQELEKSLQTYKPQIEALRQENDNLSHARGVDSGLISRRDRKIEELKAELVSERQRREKAESVARQREREKDEIEEQSRREMHNMTESTKHATLHAEILETSHKQLSADYRTRAENWKKDLSALMEGREQDRQKLARLDVVADQMRSELERSKKVNAELVESWERYREENDAHLKGLVDQGEQENEKTRELSTEMDRVVNQMRWVMGVKENVKGAE